MTWIATNSDVKFQILEPTPIMIKTEDIAHALSMICRFNGHTKEFYSVAQHSVLVADRCCPEHRLYGLLHDATEAYYGDITRPLKSILPGYRVLEGRLQRLIYAVYGLKPVLDCKCLKEADEVVLATEAFHLIGGQHLKDWTINAKPDLSLTINPLHWREAKLLYKRMILQEIAKQEYDPIYTGKELIDG